MTRRFLYVYAGLTLLACQGFADVTFTGSTTNSTSGNKNEASVVFSLAGTTLTVVLKDTTTTNDITKKFVPTDVLTAVFFGTQQIIATPVSATVTKGSSEINSNGSAYTGSQPLGGEWGYADNLTVSDGTSKLINGISSSGLSGLFGNGNFGCTSSGQHPTCDNLDGVPWGIVPATFPPKQGINGGVSGPFESNSVTFALTVGQGFNLSSINDVRFQYGTTPTDFYEVGEIEGEDALPEPRFGGAVGIILGVLLLAMGWRHRRALAQFFRIASV